MDMDKVDRAVEQTAKGMSDALDNMVADLPQDAASQMALELWLSDGSTHRHRR